MRCEVNELLVPVLIRRRRRITKTIMMMIVVVKMCDVLNPNMDMCVRMITDS